MRYDFTVVRTVADSTVVRRGGDSSTTVKAIGIRGPSGTAGITISATAPTNPETNDIWLDIS